MRDPEWVSLTDVERGQLIALWLLAADHNGQIPSSPALIQKLCFMSSPLKLNKFIELGFIIEPDASLTPERRQADAPEESREDKNRGENKDKFKDYVLLTKDEYKKLTDKYSASIINNKIDDLNNYLGSTGKKYKSHYHTILSWLRKDGTPPKIGSQQPSLKEMIS